MSDHTFNSIGFQGEITLTTASQLILPANLFRVYLMIYNLGNDIVKAKFDADFVVGENGMQISPGVSYVPLRVPTTKIYMKSASGSQTIYVKEGLKL